ncbi:MAG: hypothetical protein U0105_10900 [Candidatus Obscuribacterales bacterium]
MRKRTAGAGTTNGRSGERLDEPPEAAQSPGETQGGRRRDQKRVLSKGGSASVKCAAAIGLTFIGLIAYSWIGCAARDVVHWTGKQWDEFQSQFKPKEQIRYHPRISHLSNQLNRTSLRWAISGW